MKTFLVGYILGWVSAIVTYVLYTRPALRAKLEEEAKAGFSALTKHK